ncbi:ABC transporter permease [Govanella unica]|uniref:ABC transporter permease n=1 Tax=Govanella unica TaxID=2975056 RepID=A0A9X3Z6B9_9PROT|nr:ABC transporter permease [Govania unica]MDA5192917.1 ABC transporter permease [Govania unica]
MSKTSTSSLAKAGSIVGKRIFDLAVLILALLTVLFFLLRLTGDPAVILAGQDATPEILAEVRAFYGLDQPLFTQFLMYLGNVARLDFGTSLATGQDALDVVLMSVPATILMTLLAMLFTILVSVPMGAWWGAAPDRTSRRIFSWVIFVKQGIPGFLVALVLVQIFAIELGWLPALGYQRLSNWILPTIALSSFLVPKLTRIIATNVAEAMNDDYVRTARAIGASPRVILWRHVLPNALLGAIALIGAQFSFLIAGVVVIETIFAWPGLGRLLIHSTLSLDFPVVQALAIVISIFVFAVNALTDVAITFLDPRIRVSA